MLQTICSPFLFLGNDAKKFFFYKKVARFYLLCSNHIYYCFPIVFDCWAECDTKSHFLHVSIFIFDSFSIFYGTRTNILSGIWFSRVYCIQKANINGITSSFSYFRCDFRRIYVSWSFLHFSHLPACHGHNKTTEMS